MSVYLRPWTLIFELADEHNPHLTQLMDSKGSWLAGWNAWLKCVLSEATRQTVMNFQSVFSVRQLDEQTEAMAHKDNTPLFL